MINLKILLESFLKDFAKIDIWKKLLLVFSSLFFAFLFIENFLFSTSFATLHLREIDDLAFQASIRQFHKDLSSLRIDLFIKLNDYGYGWIFWVIVGLITYPFYLLALLTDFYAPLIIVPRQISLVFTIGSAFFIYKSLSIYSKNEFLKFIAMMLLFSFPAFGYSGLRFGTVAQVMFFSSLTFYLTIRKNTYEKKDLKHIALAAAACVGTKLNGALILPLIGFIIADRLHWNLSKENIKKAGYFLLNFLFFAVLFSNPSLFLSPFQPDYFTSYLASLSNNSHLALQDNFFQTLYDVVNIGYLNSYIAALLAAILISSIFKKTLKKKDFFFISCWLIFSLCLLSKIMSMGTLYIINYVTVVMYLIVFSLLFFENWGRLGKAFAVLILIANIALNHNNIYQEFYSGFKYFHFLKNPEIIAKIETSAAIKKSIPDPKEEPKRIVNVLMDFRAIFPYAHLERENLQVQFSFDNLQVAQKQIKENFDYISLNKTSPYLLSESEFNKNLATLKDDLLIKNQIESRKIALNLTKNGKLDNVEYEVSFENEMIIFFKIKNIKN